MSPIFISALLLTTKAYRFKKKIGDNEWTSRLSTMAVEREEREAGCTLFFGAHFTGATLAPCHSPAAARFELNYLMHRFNAVEAQSNAAFCAVPCTSINTTRHDTIQHDATQLIYI